MKVNVLYVDVEGWRDDAMSLDQLAHIAAGPYEVSLTSARTAQIVVACDWNGRTTPHRWDVLAAWRLRYAYATPDTWVSGGRERHRVGLDLGTPIPVLTEFHDGLKLHFRRRVTFRWEMELNGLPGTYVPAKVA